MGRHSGSASQSGGPHTVYVKPEPQWPSNALDEPATTFPGPFDASASQRWTREEEDVLMDCVARYPRQWPLAANLFDQKMGGYHHCRRSIQAMRKKYQQMRDEALRRALGSQTRSSRSDHYRLGSAMHSFNTRSKSSAARSSTASTSPSRSPSESPAPSSATVQTPTPTPPPSRPAKQTKAESASYKSLGQDAETRKTNRTGERGEHGTTTPSRTSSGGLEISNTKNGVRIERCPPDHTVYVFSNKRVKIFAPGQQSSTAPGEERPTFVFGIRPDGSVKALRSPDGLTQRTYCLRDGGRCDFTDFKAPDGFQVVFVAYSKVK